MEKGYVVSSWEIECMITWLGVLARASLRIFWLSTFIASFHIEDNADIRGIVEVVFQSTLGRWNSPLELVPCL
jgi:hypothetical protein